MGQEQVPKLVTGEDQIENKKRKRRKKKSHSRASRRDEATAILTGVAEEMRSAAEDIRGAAESFDEAEANDEEPNEEVETPTTETINKEIEDRVEAASKYFEEHFSTSDLESLSEEMGSWAEGLEGTNLANSDKASTIRETADSLESAVSSLDQCSFPDDLDLDDVESFAVSLDQLADDIDSYVSDIENCEFPGMYG